MPTTHRQPRINELATALQYNTKVKLFVSNDHNYGTIRLHQELKYPGRAIGTELVNPDFSRLAHAFGAKGLTIRTAQEAFSVAREALASDDTVMVDVRTSLKHISAYTTLDSLRSRRGNSE